MAAVCGRPNPSISLPLRASRRWPSWDIPRDLKGPCRNAHTHTKQQQQQTTNKQTNKNTQTKTRQKRLEMGERAAISDDGEAMKTNKKTPTTKQKQKTQTHGGSGLTWAGGRRAAKRRKQLTQIKNKPNNKQHEMQTSRAHRAWSPCVVDRIFHFFFLSLSLSLFIFEPLVGGQVGISLGV